MSDGPKTKVGVGAALGPVPETLLWTLYHRAYEARRPDAVLHDPRAVELVEAIDYPFAERFGSGRGTAVQAQAQALRALRFDQEIRSFLARHPRATVVALGEGLETQFWRVDNGHLRWLTIDLPETIELRGRLLPEGPRQRTFAGSALDPGWLAEIDASQGVLITAEGLLMYFQPDEVHQLIASLAQAFPGGELLFDSVPRWFSRRTLTGSMRTEQGYVAPPMPWGVDRAELASLRAAAPEIVELRELRRPRRRGLFFGALLPLLSLSTSVRARLPFPTIWLARFGGDDPQLR